MMVHVFNYSTQKAGADGSLMIQGQPGLPSEFQDIQDHTERFCLQTKLMCEAGCPTKQD